MKKLLYLIALYLFSVTATAEQFQLSTTETREKYFFVQLQYGLGKGKAFSQILKEIEIEKDSVAVRILGEFSEISNRELISYYKKKIPNELEKALASSGNLHNPTLRPLIKSFSAAFKTTQLFQEIETELQKGGYVSTIVEFEKYTINTKGTPKIWVADIWLRFDKTPNQSFKPTPKSGAV